LALRDSEFDPCGNLKFDAAPASADLRTIQNLTLRDLEIG
jgi:hypothetical protein